MELSFNKYAFGVPLSQEYVFAKSKVKSSVEDFLVKNFDVGTFQNDLSILESKDEVLTALIHLGYLGYDADRKSAYIPNYEVASAYQLALKKSGWSEVAKGVAD